MAAFVGISTPTLALSLEVVWWSAGSIEDARWALGSQVRAVRSRSLSM